MFTLTRDISLEDCILDLVDNSIDAAWKSSGRHPSGFDVNDDLAAYSVSICLDSDKFEMTDNCGGLHLDDAVDHAFTFGRSGQDESEYSVGVYGVGMKRSIFKIGNVINVDSTYESDSALTGFRVPINVRGWLSNDTFPWDFDIDEHPAASQAGVNITIDELFDETRDRFADPTFITNLRRVLGRDYMIPLRRGLTITVNNEKIIGERILLASTEDFGAMRATYDDAEEPDVSVEIIAGMINPPPDSNDPDAAGVIRSELSGWYVICNGRVILASDRSTITGWGTGSIPMWHPQFFGFAGLVFFSSRHAALLPMTSTKRSVHVSSAVYRRALGRMAEPTRAWIDYTNKRKGDESVRVLEEAAGSKDLKDLPVSPRVILPATKSGPVRERTTSIQFSVPVGQVRKLGNAFGVRSMTNKDVGKAAFDYAYENLVDEDDE